MAASHPWNYLGKGVGVRHDLLRRLAAPNKQQHQQQDHKKRRYRKGGGSRQPMSGTFARRFLLPAVRSRATRRFRDPLRSFAGTFAVSHRFAHRIVQRR